MEGWNEEVQSILRLVIEEPKFKLESMSSDIKKLMKEYKDKELTPSDAVAHLIGLFISVNQKKEVQYITH